jgi:hypothetical protein
MWFNATPGMFTLKPRNLRAVGFGGVDTTIARAPRLPGEILRNLRTGRIGADDDEARVEVVAVGFDSQPSPLALTRRA